MENNKGFTLIELVLVLSMIAVTAGVVVIPKMNLELLGLKRACYEFQATVRYAQRMSVTEAKTYAVMINDVAESYSCYYYNYNMPTKYNAKPDVFLKDGYRIDPSLGESKLEIAYNPWGTIRGDGAQTIYISNKKYRAEMTIVPATGRIKIVSIKKK